jgi:hypothetical protein
VFFVSFVFQTQWNCGILLIIVGVPDSGCLGSRCSLFTSTTIYVKVVHVKVVYVNVVCVKLSLAVSTNDVAIGLLWVIMNFDWLNLLVSWMSHFVYNSSEHVLCLKTGHHG